MVRFGTGDEQSHSKFFTKLHPDVRREIFLHLFGSRHVHLMFINGRGMNNDEEFWRHGHPPLTHLGWLHCVCRSGAKLLAHAHNESRHKWRYLSTHLIDHTDLYPSEGAPIVPVTEHRDHEPEGISLLSPCLWFVEGHVQFQEADKAHMIDSNAVEVD
jgi:hypothetical protein